MRSSILLLALVFVIISTMGCSRSGSDAAPTAAPSASAAPTASPTNTIPVNAPDFDITAAKILDAFQADGKVASGRFRGKTALIFGPLGEVGKDDARGDFVSLPKNPDDAAKDAPKLRCFLKKGEKAALASRTKGDNIDIIGTIDEANGEVFLRNCVVDTQLKVCQAVRQVLGRGNCEANKEKLGARWSSTADVVEVVCQSPGGFAAWSKEWASIPKEQQTKTKASVDTTSCHAVPEAINIRLVVDLTVALGRIRWVDNTPTLAP